MSGDSLSTARRFEDRKRSALRVRQDSHAAEIFNRHRRHVELRTQILSFRGGRVAIGHLQIDLPVRRRCRIAKRRRENSANELVVVKQMVVVVSGLFVFLPDAPPE